jgi:hypothetical protein
MGHLYEENLGLGATCVGSLKGMSLIDIVVPSEGNEKSEGEGSGKKNGECALNLRFGGQRGTNGVVRMM